MKMIRKDSSKSKKKSFYAIGGGGAAPSSSPEGGGGGNFCSITVVPKELAVDRLDAPSISAGATNTKFTPNQHLIRIVSRFPDIPKACHDFMHSREVGEFLSGALAGAMTKAVLAPLETIRTRMVVGVGSKDICGSFIQVIEQHGWQGLWAGNAINMLRIIPSQAIELGTFEYVKRAMTSTQEKWKQDGNPKVKIGNVNLNISISWVSPVAVAGAAAGVISTLVCHPLEVLKDRLTISPEIYPSISLGTLKICKDSGIGGFYAGISPTLVGMLPYSTCYYFMYETMKKSYCQAKEKVSLNRPEMLLIGALSGLTASTISFPLEVARKRLMVGALQGKCPPHMIAALSEVIREEGIMGLYRGWGASCLKVMPSSGITWMFYEAWKDIFLGQMHKKVSKSQHTEAYSK